MARACSRTGAVAKRASRSAQSQTRRVALESLRPSFESSPGLKIPLSAPPPPGFVRASCHRIRGALRRTAATPPPSSPRWLNWLWNPATASQARLSSSNTPDKVCAILHVAGQSRWQHSCVFVSLGSRWSVCARQSITSLAAHRHAWQCPSTFGRSGQPCALRAAASLSGTSCHIVRHSRPCTSPALFLLSGLLPCSRSSLCHSLQPLGAPMRACQPRARP